MHSALVARSLSCGRLKTVDETYGGNVFGEIGYFLYVLHSETSCY
jgi:hypothetical protein